MGLRQRLAPGLVAVLLGCATQPADAAGSPPERPAKAEQGSLERETAPSPTEGRATPRPGAAPRPGQVETLPPGVPASTPLPTVIALHGRGSDAATFARFVRRLAPQARIISLQAPLALGPGYTWFESRVATEDQQGLAREVEAALSGLRPQLALLLGQPSCGRPLLLGYSQGGVLVLALAAERFPGAAAFIDLSGTLPSGYPVAPGKRTAPVFSLHATEDALVPIASTRLALQRLREAGVSVTAVELPGGHDPSPPLREEAARRLLPLLKAECPAAFTGLAPPALP